MKTWQGLLLRLSEAEGLTWEKVALDQLNDSACLGTKTRILPSPSLLDDFLNGRFLGSKYFGFCVLMVRKGIDFGEMGGIIIPK